MVRDLESVLAEHGDYMPAPEGVGFGWRCWCGADLRNWWPAGGVTPRDTALSVALRAHLAAVIEAEVIRPREREAWEAGHRAGRDYDEGHYGNPYAGEVE